MPLPVDRRRVRRCLASLVLAMTACAAPPIDDADLAAAGADTANWLTYGRTYDEQRHSPLAQINDSTVTRLGLAWVADLGVRRGLEATPLVHDGTMYVTSAWSVVHAFDAASGRPLWTYDPAVPKDHSRFACCDVVNRGAALYRGRVYAATLDGRLLALDARSGTLAWEVRTTPAGSAYTITGAPRIARGMVLIGNGGAEYGVRGYVTAYDAATGVQRWRTYTVPGNPSEPFESDAMARAATTWDGRWWEVGGGGTAWDAIVYDPLTDLVFIGVGNGSPWYRRLRSPGGGDNLYLSSVLAVRATDGAYVWHFQTTPGDNWDYTATQPIMLAELDIGGRRRDVLMQAPKNGFFYVLDRRTGAYISGASYARQTWTTGLDAAGRPIEVAAARELPQPMLVWPSDLGAHNWHPMAFNPSTGLVYFPVTDAPLGHVVDSAWRYNPREMNIGGGAWPASLTRAFQDAVIGGYLVAWDPVAQTERWRAPTTPISGGVLSTAGGLVFQGDGSGVLRAFRAADGAERWRFDAGVGIAAPPMTYAVADTQYVAVLAGWGGPNVLWNAPSGRGRVGPGRLLVFRLGGTATLPPAEEPPGPVTAPTFAMAFTATDSAAGAGIYGTFCVRCHGDSAVGGGLTPDLRRTSAAVHEVFADIVRGGQRRALGMPSFAEDLDVRQVLQVQAYILARARQDARREGRPAARTPARGRAVAPPAAEPPPGAERRDLAVGEEFTVTQGQNSASTGYTWSVVELPEFLTQADHGSAPVDALRPPPPGAPYRESWRFRAVRPGTGLLRMVYRRPWEQTAAPTASATYFVVVR